MKPATNVCVGLFITLSASGALASEGSSQQVLKRIATAMAYERVCDSVVLDDGKAGNLIASRHLQLGKGQDDNKLVTKLAVKALADIIDSNDADFCASALALFGPNGTSEAGLLKEK